MSENSADSTIEEEKEEQERKDRGVEPSGIAKRLKALFCCFRRESNAKEIIGYDPDEYDYIVEKLIVKRVPLALFAIPADLAADRRRPDDAPTTPDDVSQSSSLSAFGGNNSTASVVTRGMSCLTSTRTDRTVYDSATNKALRNKDQDLSLDCQAKSSVRKQGMLSRFCALHPDLREFEKPSKNPPNFPRSKQSFAEDISVTSSTRTDISSRTSTSSMVVQDDVLTRDNSTRRGSALESERNDRSRAKKEDDSRQAWNPSTEKDRDKFVLGRNRRYIVSPFRVRRGSLDLAKPKNVVGNFGVDGKSLAYIQESLEEKSLESAEDSKDRDVQSNTAVRWRVTIRRRRANADSEVCQKSTFRKDT
ncbi:unnamed protein product [Lasius platythorax]|uniref:Uncharacterized protein n=1 Tax=Lasius platythorax TaxID=488582 RepID=A0AAV2P602_9HYME